MLLFYVGWIEFSFFFLLLICFAKKNTFVMRSPNVDVNRSNSVTSKPPFCASRLIIVGGSCLWSFLNCQVFIYCLVWIKRRIANASFSLGERERRILKTLSQQKKEENANLIKPPARMTRFDFNIGIQQATSSAWAASSMIHFFQKKKK